MGSPNNDKEIIQAWFTWLKEEFNVNVEVIRATDTSLSESM